MKIGASERTFFDVWHPDAAKLFNKSSSLSRVCWELYDPSIRLPDAEKDITVFSCFQPQLAAFKKENISEVTKKMAGKIFYIEEKLDGERIQLHKKADQFRYWSRRAKDYTYLYGTSYGDATNQEGGGLSKYLRNAFDSKVRSVVLDGEMISWNDNFDAPIPFGSLKTAAKAEASNTNTSFDAHPFYCVFDILHLNGRSLTAYSLRERRQVLHRIIKPVSRRIEIVDVEEASKEFEIESRLRACVAQSSEGLIIKDPDSTYHPNERNDSWIKVKPEYMSEFGENLDLLVIGGYWGQGRRGNKLTAFMCGLRIDDPSGAKASPEFISFCRVGGGFGGPDYAQIHHTTEGHWQKFDPRNPPPRQIHARSQAGIVIEAPDMWIEPEHSIVFQLKAASSGPSDQFGAKVTLRFPRFERIREDKDWRTATSVNEFIDMQHDATYAHEQKEMKAHIRRKRAFRKEKSEVKILGADNDRLKDRILDFGNSSSSSLFSGLEFYVMTESIELEMSKKELEELICAHGGIVVQHEGLPHDLAASMAFDKTSSKKRKRAESPVSEPRLDSTIDWHGVHILAERKVVKVMALASRCTHDIFRPIYLTRCISTNTILDIEPIFMYQMTNRTKTLIASSSLDQYGDSWVNDVDVSTLQRLLKVMSSDHAKEQNDDPELCADTEASGLTVTALEIKRSLQDSQGDDMSPLWMFSRIVAYFEHVASETVSLFRAADGQVAQDIHDTSMTHLIVSEDIDRTSLIRLRSMLSLRDLKTQPRLVYSSWVSQSWSSRTVLSEERYAPPK